MRQWSDLRRREARIVERPPTRRDDVPADGHRAHQTGTVPGMRERGLRSTPTRPAARRPAGGPRPSEHDQTRRDPVERVRADLTVPKSDAGDRPVHTPRPGRRRPQPGLPGGRQQRSTIYAAPHGGYAPSTDTPQCQPLTVASSRHGVKPAPTKATPAPMPGVTVTEGAQPRGTVGVSGRSPTGAGRRSPATLPVRSTHPRAWIRRHREGPVGSPNRRSEPGAHDRRQTRRPKTTS